MDKVKLAYDNTDPMYHQYIQVIKGKPYMAVDGRIARFVDDHKASGNRFKIHPPQLIEAGEQYLMQVTVQSDIYGEATGMSRIFVNGRGVDATNPFENAQTSAIGRALGFFGYGLFGAGIASADEVETAVAQQEANLDVSEQGRGQGPTITTNSNTSSAGASKADFRRTTAVMPEEAQAFNRKAFWAQAREAMQDSAKNDDDLRAYIKSNFNTESTKELTLDQQQEVIAWLDLPLSVAPAKVEEDDIPDDGIEDVSWGHVIAQCRDKGIDTDRFARYVLDKNQMYKKGDIWDLPVTVATRYSRLMDSEACGQMLKEMEMYA